MSIPLWARNGLVAGLLAFVFTLLGNLVILVVAPADLCRTGPLIIPAAMLGGFLLFLLCAATAGFLTGRITRPMPDAALCGLVVGAISGAALIVQIPFMPAVQQHIQDLMTACPGTGGFSFSFGGTPPPGFFQSPPPGFFGSPPAGFPSPPAGFVASLPPGAFGPPTGVFGTVLSLVGAAFSIAIGLGVATGVAILAGMVGAANRRRVP